MSTEIIDGESVSVTRDGGFDAKPMSLETIDAQDQSERGLRLFEERVRVAREQLRIALKLTTPSQWVVMDGGNGKQSVYATAGAADRILRMGFGMRWAEKSVHIERVRDPDLGDAIIATCTAQLLKHDGAIYESFTGTRRAPFNDEGSLKGYLKHEQDLVKGAIANMKHCAVTSLLGLTFLSPEDFKELGLGLDKLDRRVEFQTRDGDVASDVPIVPFGKNKGKPITELSARSLEWYINAAKDNIVDPSKDKWRAKEQKWLDALVAEQAVRNTAGTPTPEQMPEWVEEMGQ